MKVGPNTFWILAGASLIEAIYLAAEHQPTNAYVLDIMAHGLKHTIRIDEATPDDCCIHIKQIQNEFHHGSAMTFVEFMEQAITAQADWEAHCWAKSITVQACPNHGNFRYDKLYEDFVMKKYGKVFKKWEAFDNTKAVANKLKKFKIYDKARQWIENEVDFLNSGYDNVVCAGHLNQLLVQIQKVGDCHPSELLALAMMEVLPFVFPVAGSATASALAIAGSSSSSPAIVEDVCGPDSNWIFNKSIPVKKEDGKGHAAWLSAPMDGSLIYAPKTETNKTATKGRKKNEPAAASPSAVDVEDETFNVHTPTGRVKLVLDDILAAICSPLSKLGAGAGESAQYAWLTMPAAVKAAQRALKHSYMILWKKEIMMNGKTVDKWSPVRKISRPTS